MCTIVDIIFYIVILYLVIFLLYFSYGSRNRSFFSDITVNNGPLVVDKHNTSKKVKFANPIIKSIHIY